MMIYWTRIDHGTAVGVRNGRGRSLRRRSDVSLRRLSRCLRSLAERCARRSPRTPVSACAWSRCGSRISARKWRSCSGRPKRSPDPIKSRRRSEEQKVRTAITVSGPFHPYQFGILIREFNRYFLMCAPTTPEFRIPKFLLDPAQFRKYCWFHGITLLRTSVPNFNKFSRKF